jgi:hypothetical protein
MSSIELKQKDSNIETNNIINKKNNNQENLIIDNYFSEEENNKESSAIHLTTPIRIREKENFCKKLIKKIKFYIHFDLNI